MTLPQGPNQRWSLDFVSDVLADGRRLRVLVVVDDFTRECLALVADTSVSGRRVVGELDRIVELRGRPLLIVSDNGTELTSHAILLWQEERDVAWHYIAPLPVSRPVIRSRREHRQEPVQGHADPARLGREPERPLPRRMPQ